MMLSSSAPSNSGSRSLTLKARASTPSVESTKVATTRKMKALRKLCAKVIAVASSAHTVPVAV